MRTAFVRRVRVKTKNSVLTCPVSNCAGWKEFSTTSLLNWISSKLDRGSVTAREREREREREGNV